ncbi:MAG: hypothetical protein AAFZ91_12355 [Pseudomonadota bacterium]
MNSKYDLKPGDIVSVRFNGVMRHYGVVTYGGRIMSNNGRLGGVISQSLTEFADGRRVKHHGSSSDGDDYLAHARARRKLGHDYHLTGSNCVHYVRHAKGQRPTSTQYARAGLMALSDLLRSRR